MTTVTVGTNLIYIPSWTTSTNLGPLPTTAFPSDCLNSIWDFNTPGLGMPWTHMTQGCAAKTCCPSGNFYTEPWAWMTSYYSPGVCPSQYRSCDGPPPPSALTTAPGETIAFCCPTNYNCPYTVGDFFQYCQSPLSASTTVIVVDNIFDQKTLSTSTWTMEPGFEYSWQVAYPIQVRTRTSDGTTAAMTTTEGTTGGTTGSTTASTSESTAGSDGGGSSVSQSTSTPANTSTPSSSGLGTAGIVGVVISATCSVLGLAFGVGFKIWKHKKQQKKQTELVTRENLEVMSKGVIVE